MKISEWLGTGSINIFGRPFAGKDTQCRKLADDLSGKLIGSGEILRSYHDQGQLNQIMSTGKLIPTDLYQQIVLPYFSKPDFKHLPLILSSVGRMKGEESVVMEAAFNSNHPIKAVIFLQLSEHEVMNRFEAAQKLKDRGQRPDDGRDVLNTRLQEFKIETIPVLDYYRQRELLIEVNGALSREEVFEQILDKLLILASKHKDELI